MSSIKKTDNELLDHLDRRLPSNAQRILIAFSGGPDSTALLSLAAELRSRRGIAVYAGYVDHALRPQAERRAELTGVVSTAAQLGIPLCCTFLSEVAMEGERRKGGPEAAARRLRYTALRRLRSALRADLICTAHTRDDQTETILMRLLQGAGPEGLAGIPARTEGIARPLLEIEKDRLREYLQQRGIPWSSDSSNASSDYLRNGLRNRLMPLVEEIVPGYAEGLYSLAEKSKKAAEALRRHVPLPSIEWGEPGAGRVVQCDRRSYLELGDWGREELLYRMFDALQDRPEYRLPYRFVRDAAARAARGEQGILARGHGIVIEMGERVLLCRTDIVSRGRKGYLIHIEAGRYRLWERTECTITLLSPEESRGEPRPDAGDEIVMEPALQPYLLRSPREGDTLRYAGGRHRALKELFYEHAIPADQRGLVPVVQNRKGIVAVCAEPWGGPRVRAGEQTPISPQEGYRIRLRFHTTGVST